MATTALDDILTLRRGRIGILDGGQATHLESQGFDLSGPRWSAGLLASKEDGGKGREAIRRVHADFLASGADVVGTMTYQLCDLAWHKALGGRQVEEGEVEGLMGEAIRLAAEARKGHCKTTGRRALVSLSLGPYGAALANGAEYTGAYPSAVDLADFHAHRLRQALTSPYFDSDVDLVAFETIPRLDEAQAILHALEAVAREQKAERKLPAAYISFVFPPEADGQLPGNGGKHGVKDVVSLIANQQHSKWPIAGLGVNCTKMFILEKVMRQLSEIDSSAGSNHLHLFLYPDGGLTWDGINRCWLPPAAASSGKQSWAQSLRRVAEEACPRWRGVWVGGCCQVRPGEIAKLKE